MWVTLCLFHSTRLAPRSVSSTHSPAGADQGPRRHPNDRVDLTFTERATTCNTSGYDNLYRIWQLRIWSLFHRLLVEQDTRYGSLNAVQRTIAFKKKDTSKYTVQMYLSSSGFGNTFDKIVNHLDNPSPPGHSDADPKVTMSSGEESFTSASSHDDPPGFCMIKVN